MAGIGAMGDLSHELESLIVQIGNGTAAGDERARAVAQEAIDELARMREQVAAGRAVPQAHALIANIQAVARGAVHAVEAAPALPSEPAPPPRAPIVRRRRRRRYRRRRIAAGATDTRSRSAIGATDARGIDAACRHKSRAAARTGRRSGCRTGRSNAGRTNICGRGIAGAGRCAVAAGVARAGDRRTAGPRTGGRRRARRDGARQRGTARPAAQQCRRSEHLARAARAATRLGGIQPRRAVAHRHAAQGAAAQARDRDRGAGAASARPGAGPSAGIRSARARSLFIDPAVLARAGGVGQRRRQPAATAREPGRRGAEPAAAAVAHRHGTAERPDAHAHGVVPAACAAPGAHRAAGRGRYRQAAELVVEGATGELDRQVLERMLPPFEHLLRNAVVHGIETPGAARGSRQGCDRTHPPETPARGRRGDRRRQR